jgi:nicotinamide-nucleotide amidase
MTAQIITIGDELLIGQTVDTNSAWMGMELSNIGFDVLRKTSVHDLRKDILSILEETCGKSDVVLITGGLGPTSDDITKQTLCEFFDTRLIINPDVLHMIEKMMKLRGFPMNYNNQRQAEVPESCRILMNAAGTAPGLWFEKEGTVFVSMPGVPHEMRYLMTEHVIPEFKKRYTTQTIIHRNIMTYGVPEAKLAELLEGFEASLPEEMKLAYLPASGIIKLRLTGKGPDKKMVISIVEEQVVKLYRTIPDLIFSENGEPFEVVIGKLLKEKHRTLATSESCTGGRIAEMLTTVPGSSEYYKGSVIAYDNSIKEEVLGVPSELIRKYGAVSVEVAAAMAEGAKKLLKTDFSVATSGIAGPDGGTDPKPIGTICIAVASDGETLTKKYQFGSDRLTNINRFSVAALSLLRNQIIRL